MDWLASWGITSTVGFILKPILENLAKDAAKDWVKDLFKDSLKTVIRPPSQNEQTKAAGKAIKEFLLIIQNEMLDADLSEDDLKKFIKPLQRFIQDKRVKIILGSPFQVDFPEFDTSSLIDKWSTLDLPLPDEFNWQKVSKRYVRHVKSIIQESDELRHCLDSQNLDKIANSVEQIAGIPSDFDLSKYKEGILERYGNLNLDNLDTTGYAYNELKLWQMFIPQNVRETRNFLPQQYEIPKEIQKKLKHNKQMEEISEEELKKFQEAYKEEAVWSVLDLIDDNAYRCMVFLGDPGSGKSTLLQYIALKWAEESLKKLPTCPLPLLIELRTYVHSCNEGQCKDFLSFCHSGNIFCRLNQQELHKQLQSGNVIAMFDGLDEIFDPQKREEVITAICRFSNEYPNIRIIVTSRIIGYKPQRFRDAEFRHFLIQDLEYEQIDNFILKWHKLNYSDKFERDIKQKRLERAIKNSSAIHELAGNPLLLTMMAILNRNQELPKDRSQLYNQASKVLLHQWDIERTLIDESLDPKTIDYTDKQEILRQVAFHMQDNEKGLKGNLISKKDLERVFINHLNFMGLNNTRVITRVLIEKLRIRNFILCHVGADYYAFVHRTFLEYFCASEFIERFRKRGSNEGISLEQLERKVFGQHWSDESWHEVLRLIVGMIDTIFAQQIIKYLIELHDESEEFINLFLAADCFAEVRNIHTVAEIKEQLLNKLKALVNYDLNYYYSEKDFEERNFVGKIRTKSVNAIVKIWENSDALAWLKSLAQKDDNSNVRRVAVQELARGWKTDPDTLDIVKSLAQKDDNPDVRMVAVQELARGWKTDPDILAWLKSLAQKDDNSNVRRVAVYELARGWKTDPDILDIVKSLAQEDDNPD
ncbi:MAG: NACHT domain-containing protein, partial [Desulfobacteraceae bacterium]|nr:NACHT domain-containing protein [Desulfobacteraceae bacterium]